MISSLRSYESRQTPQRSWQTTMADVGMQGRRRAVAAGLGGLTADLEWWRKSSGANSLNYKTMAKSMVGRDDCGDKYLEWAHVGCSEDTDERISSQEREELKPG